MSHYYKTPFKYVSQKNNKRNFSAFQTEKTKKFFLSNQDKFDKISFIDFNPSIIYENEENMKYPHTNWFSAYSYKPNEYRYFTDLKYIEPNKETNSFIDGLRL
jgi:hypothetical protein